MRGPCAATVALLLAAGLVAASPAVAATPLDSGPGSASVRTAVRPADGFAVTIAGPGPSADPFVPFVLSADPIGGLPPFTYLWTGDGLGVGRSANWTVTLSPNASVTISLAAGDGASDYATANFTVTTVPSPALSIAAGDDATDVGVPVPATFAITGGVAPYSLTWTVSGGDDGGTASVPKAGSLTEPVAANGSGPLWVAATVTDSVGGAASATADVATVGAALDLIAPEAAVETEVAAPVALDLLAVGGAPPIRWSFGVDGPVEATTPPNGTEAGPGPIAWAGTFPTAGNFTLVATVADAIGVERSANVSVEVVPAVGVGLAFDTLPAAANGSVSVSVVLSGGFAPYAYAIALSDGEATHGNRSGPGAVDWTANPDAGGYLTATVVATDAAGRSASAASTIELPARSVPSPTGGGGAPAGDDAMVWAVAAFAIGAGAGAVAVRFLPRRPGPPALSMPPPGPESTVERILAEDGPVGREDLEYLAQEAGVDVDSAQRAIETGLARGRIRVVGSGESEKLAIVPTPREAAARPPEAA